MRVSELMRSEVITESGDRLGHVFDVRVARRARSARDRADQQWKVVGLIVGKRGLRERFGFTRGRHGAPKLGRDLIFWDAVVRLDGRSVVVRDGTEPA